MTILKFASNAREDRSNNSAVELVEHAVRLREGELTATGALAVRTGQHTGRSASDKFAVKDAETESQVWWDNVKPLTPGQFDRLFSDFQTYADGRNLFVQDLYAGADPQHRLPARIITQYAWHALFIHHLLRRPAIAELNAFEPQLTVVSLPEFRADPSVHGTSSETVIACDFTRRMVLIGGTAYAGEIKKSVFSFLNYLLPPTGVMPMHCSANVGDSGDTAVFFGLSGTGKTTLSADPRRTLLGDDEHGWSSGGIFNFEGGCYAKTIRLSADAEPAIFAASNSFASVLENVVLDSDRVPDFDDGSLTENARSAYPLEAIPNASKTGCAGHPKSLVMLTADAFGVMPPIARLTPAQAMYHFLSGYTAKVAGTERGMGSEPQATFSACFGAPFMPRHPSVYGNLLRRLIADHDVACWLVNTGWTGGKFGDGKRMPLGVTRLLLNAALSGELSGRPMQRDPVFGFMVPTELDRVDPRILTPRSTWSDPALYDTTAARLAEMFNKNFAAFTEYVPPEVMAAGPLPAARRAAE